MFQFAESSARVPNAGLPKYDGCLKTSNSSASFSKSVVKHENSSYHSSTSDSSAGAAMQNSVGLSDLALLCYVASDILAHGNSASGGGAEVKKHETSQCGLDQRVSRPRVPLASRGFKPGKYWLAKKAKLNYSSYLNTFGGSACEDSTLVNQACCSKKTPEDAYSGLTPHMCPSTSTHYECVPSSASSIDPDSSLLSPPMSPELGNASKRDYEKHAESLSRLVGLGLRNPLPPVVLPRNTPRAQDLPAASGLSVAPERPVAHQHHHHAVQQHPIVQKHCEDQPHKVDGSNEQPKTRRVILSKPNVATRVCISCHCNQTPCWRPSWDPDQGQLCNSCGLRYRKSRMWCSSLNCSYIPSKLELSHIRATRTSLRCPKCQAGLAHN